mgnify:CR=1 FL=1
MLGIPVPLKEVSYSVELIRLSLAFLNLELGIFPLDLLPCRLLGAFMHLDIGLGQSINLRHLSSIIGHSDPSISWSPEKQQ